MPVSVTVGVVRVGAEEAFLVSGGQAIAVRIDHLQRRDQLGRRLGLNLFLGGVFGGLFLGWVFG